ncbi:MAG: putative toxin-antitoxin system toxin component, PIN family [Caldilineaceae bacterium]
MDTDVIVASLRSKTGASREIIRRIGLRQITALASVALLVEYEAVLKRPEHLQAANLTMAQVDIFLDTLAYLCVPVTPYFLWRPLLKDPNDEMIIETAVNGQAQVIITFNTRHFGNAASRFGIQVLKPGEFLQKMT